MLILTFAAIAMTMTALFMFARINLVRFLGYAAVVDVVFSVALLYLFANTFSGIVASALAGMFMTIALSVLRRTLGYETIRWHKWYKLPRWEYTPPTWNLKGFTEKLQEKVYED